MSKHVLLPLVVFLVVASAVVSTQPPPSQSAQPTPQTAAPPSSPAAQVLGYERRCATCHDNPGQDSRAPSREALRQFTPERVYAALTTGPMAVNAANMTDADKRMMAELVTGKPFGTTASRAASSMKNRCQAPLAITNPWTQPRWNGWSPDPETQWRFQPAAAAGITADQVPRLKVKWAFAMPGAGAAAWSQPTVVGGGVFMSSDNGYVYALDAKTGCVHWSYEALGQVRSGVTVGDFKDRPGVRYAAYFGDYRGNIYAVNAETGEQLWTTRADPHEGAKITSALVLDPNGGRLFVPVASWEEIPAPDLAYKCCTFQGSLVALDIKTGKQLWKTYTYPERPQPLKKNSAGTQLFGPAGAAIWNPPTIDLKRRVVYVGTGNPYIVAPNATADDSIMAFDYQTGKRLWFTHMGPPDPHPGGCGRTPEERRINCPGYINGRDDDSSGAPVLVTLANGRSLVIESQESGRITAVDPDKSGDVVWVVQAGDELASPNNGFGGAFDGELYFKPMPFDDQTGAIAAIRAATGERVWQTKIPKPAGCGNPPPNGGNGGPNVETIGCHSGNWAGATAIAGAVFTGSRDGVLRAYSSKDGKIIWEFKTNQPYETVNGVPGHGGGLGGPGPTIVNGMLFIGSGYDILFGATGNVLLAFAPE
jgi:polyvinyl alcohol dehydrogenase (cytochrome)